MTLDNNAHWVAGEPQTLLQRIVSVVHESFGVELAIRRNGIWVLGTAPLDSNCVVRILEMEGSGEFEVVATGPTVEAERASLATVLAAAEAFRTVAAHQTALVATVHELCHSLVILGLALEGARKADDPRHNVSVASREAELALYIVRNLLSAASERRYAEAVKPRTERVNLSEMLSDLAELYGQRAKKRGIAVVCEGLERMPEVRGDAMELRRAFHNLLANAVKYSFASTENASREVKIVGRAMHDPGFRQRRCSVTIQNYGIGVSDGEHARIFEPGFRGESARREVPVGSGIGLSEARKVLAAHGGEIRFTSRFLHAHDDVSVYLNTALVTLPLPRN